MYTVLGNADVVLENLNTIADERGVILSEELLQPWEDASVKAEEFKNYATAEVSSLINEDGIVTTFNTTAKMLFEKAFGSGETAANKFKTQVSNSINIIKTKLETENPNITKYLKDPWNDGVNAANTFSTETGKVLDKLVTNAKSAANQISSYADGIIQDMRNAQAAIDATGGSSSGDGENDNDGNNITPPPKKQKKKYYQYSYTGGLYYYQCGSDAQGKDWSSYYFRRSSKIPYGTKLTTDDIETLYYKSGSKFVPTRGMTHPVIYAGKKYVEEYAKGTTGTKKDQWAITDEPQFGDELVMYATPEGRLSYMRAGSTVVPADLTKELMKIGELGISGLQNMGGAIQGINLMSNVINKP